MDRTTTRDAVRWRRVMSLFGRPWSLRRSGASAVSSPRSGVARRVVCVPPTDHSNACHTQTRHVQGSRPRRGARPHGMGRVGGCSCCARGVSSSCGAPRGGSLGGREVLEAQVEPRHGEGEQGEDDQELPHGGREACDRSGGV